jgi:uncharacterized heparinase superfamily protein
MIKLLKSFIKYWHTIRYLRFIQIFSRFKIFFWKSKVHFDVRNSLNENLNNWVKPSARKQKMFSENSFIFLNEAHKIKSNDWNNSDISKLWLYNLHYFDDLNAFDAENRKKWHVDLIDNWIIKNPPINGVGWDSYPISLRIVNWIKWNLAGNSLKASWIHSLEVQTRFLSKNIENHLLGNHVFSNAKALIFAGLFFKGDESKIWYSKGLKIIQRELPEQVLNDGGNFELSTMYHLIFLEDLLDIVNIHKAYAVNLSANIEDRIKPMLRWMNLMCHPDGEISFFNDAALSFAPSVDEIKSYAERLSFINSDDLQFEDSNSYNWLKDSGYVRVNAYNSVAILDCAAIGPDYLPGHGHADTLCFELSLYGERFIVNSGTSVYGDGEKRQRERSTASHSTVVIDEENSSEVWGGFRVARRAKVINYDYKKFFDNIIIKASHNGYHRLSGKPTHSRTWQFLKNKINIVDNISGSGNHLIDTYLHLHPKVILKKHKKNIVYLEISGNKIKIEYEEKGTLKINKSNYHPEFGMSIESSSLQYRIIGDFPIEISTSISWL